MWSDQTREFVHENAEDALTYVGEHESDEVQIVAATTVLALLHPDGNTTLRTMSSHRTV